MTAAQRIETRGAIPTEGLVVDYGKCCRPVPGDDIRGHVSVGRGIVIHRIECTVAQPRKGTAQERLVHLLEAREGEGGGMDAETRARLRSIDIQVLRILDDLSAGRQDLVTEIRQDIAGLTEALRGAVARGRF